MDELIARSSEAPKWAELCQPRASKVADRRPRHSPGYANQSPGSVGPTTAQRIGRAVGQIVQQQRSQPRIWYLQAHLDEPLLPRTNTRPPAGMALNQLGRMPPKSSVPVSRDESRYPSVAERNSIRAPIASTTAGEMPMAVPPRTTFLQIQPGTPTMAEWDSNVGYTEYRPKADRGRCVGFEPLPFFASQLSRNREHGHLELRTEQNPQNQVWKHHETQNDRSGVALADVVSGFRRCRRPGEILRNQGRNHRPSGLRRWPGDRPVAAE